jgi:pimeloyl-ACP methyl ester carboxylesterase
MNTVPFARTVRGSGPTGLALAHGAGGSVAAHFGAVLDRLATGRTVVGVDYPGSGETPRSTEPLSLDQLADEVVEAAADEGLERFAVLGFSLGGPVAIRAATRHPDRVSGLVLTGAFPYPDSFMQLSMEVTGGVMAAGNPLLTAELLTLFSLSHEALSAQPLEALRAASAAAAQAMSAGTPEQFDLFARVDVRDDLARVSVPTLVVGGRDDLVVPFALQRSLAAAIPGARLAEIDSGHLVAVEQPERWLQQITTFLEEHQA